MRLFLGFAPAAAERDIYQLCQSITGAQVLPAELPLRWVPSENWHVTLAFLGEIANARLVQLVDVLTPVITEHSQMQLSFEALAWFPSTSKARMLTLLAEALDPLLNLQREVVAELRREAFHTERRAYRPHLTLARLKGRRKDYAPPALPAIEPLTLQLQEVILFESVQAGPAPVYEPLQQFGLRP